MRRTREEVIRELIEIIEQEAQEKGEMLSGFSIKGKSIVVCIADPSSSTLNERVKITNENSLKLMQLKLDLIYGEFNLSLFQRIREVRNSIKLEEDKFSSRTGFDFLAYATLVMSAVVRFFRRHGGNLSKMEKLVQIIESEIAN